VIVENGFSGAENKCASSEVAIAGDALRRPSWHRQAVSMSTSDGSFNRLTLGSAPTRLENYTLAGLSVNEFVCSAVINFTSQPVARVYLPKNRDFTGI
jgi:hypothetical protein